jgi:hypothetical protein
VGVISVLSLGLAAAPGSTLIVTLVAGTDAETGGAILSTIGAVAQDTSTGQNNNPGDVKNDLATNAAQNGISRFFDKFDSNEVTTGPNDNSELSDNTPFPQQGLQSPSQSLGTYNALNTYSSYTASYLPSVQYSPIEYLPASTPTSPEGSDSFSNTYYQSYSYW